MRKFPYREEGDPPRLRPTVDVELRFGPNALWRTRALVDTGSPITVFDYASAEALLVRFNNAGAEQSTIQLLGATRRVQFEYVDICLLDDPTLTWSIRIGFLTDPTFVMPFQGLLGTEGFLDRWAVTFNAYYNYFLLQQPDDAPA